MTDVFSRTELLLGNELFQKLRNKKIVIFGLGGVGGAVCEGIARLGISNLALFDFDIIQPSTLNRLISADGNDVGKMKTQAAKERTLSINPDAKIEIFNEFIDGENYEDTIAQISPDFIVDAIDSLNPKIKTLKKLARGKIKFISSMGAGGRMDPSQVRIGALSDVKGCGLASRIKRVLRNDGIDISKIKTAYSEETPVKPFPAQKNDSPQRGRTRGTQASCITVPVTFGMFIAHYILAELIKDCKNTAQL